METLTPGHHYFVCRNDRVDAFRGKRYSSPEVEERSEVYLQGRLLEQRGSEAKLHLTGNAGHERDEQDYVFSEHELVHKDGAIHCLEVHGPIPHALGVVRRYHPFPPRAAAA